MLPHCLGFFYAGFALVAKCFPICDYNKKRTVNDRPFYRNYLYGITCAGIPCCLCCVILLQHPESTG